MGYPPTYRYVVLKLVLSPLLAAFKGACVIGIGDVAVHEDSDEDCIYHNDTIYPQPRCGAYRMRRYSHYGS